MASPTSLLSLSESRPLTWTSRTGLGPPDARYRPVVVCTENVLEPKEVLRWRTPPSHGLRAGSSPGPWAKLLLWRLKMIREVTSAAHLLSAHFISVLFQLNSCLIKLWTDDEHIC